MGHHTERLREIVNAIPKSFDGLTPKLAYMGFIALANNALRDMAELEERNEDLSKEIDRLTEMLLEKDGAPEWRPDGR